MAEFIINEFCHRWTDGPAQSNLLGPCAQTRPRLRRFGKPMQGRRRLEDYSSAGATPCLQTADCNA